MRNVKRLATTRDPASRAAKAAEVVREATTRADEARDVRDAAAMCLVRKHDARPVEVQTRMRVARNAYVRLRKRFPDADVPSYGAEQAWRILDSKAAEVVKYTGIADDARAVRDDAAREMIASGNYRPADVVKKTGLTSARVAQLDLAAAT